MSRLARKPVILPDGVTIRKENSRLLVSGPKGAVSVPVSAGVAIEQNGNEINFKSDASLSSVCGTTWSLTRNAILGVISGYAKILDIEGVGFKAVLQGKELILSLGFVDQIHIGVPDGIEVKVEKGSVTISGVSKEQVGEFAARIRALKKPEPYKGKGIRYRGEVIRRKAGKKAAATGAAT